MIPQIRTNTNGNLADYNPFMIPDYAPLHKVYKFTISEVGETKTYDQRADTERMVPTIKIKETGKWLKLTSTTNQRTLGRLYGPAFKDWLGKQIGLVVDEKNMFGELGRIFYILPPTQTTFAPRKPKQRNDYAKTNTEWKSPTPPAESDDEELNPDLAREIAEGSKGATA